MRTFRCAAVAAVAVILLILLGSGCELLGLVPEPRLAGMWRGMKETGDVPEYFWMSLVMDADGSYSAEAFDVSSGGLVSGVRGTYAVLDDRSLELTLVESYDPADGAWLPASGTRLVIYLLSGDVLFIGIDLDRDGCPEAMTSYVRE